MRELAPNSRTNARIECEEEPPVKDEDRDAFFVPKNLVEEPSYDCNKWMGSLTVFFAQSLSIFFLD